MLERFLSEDIGAGDITTNSIVPPDAASNGYIVAKAGGVVAGLPLAELVFQMLDPSIAYRALVQDGQKVERGQVLAKPSSITPHTKFSCEVYVLSKDEGGRHTPFFKGYRPQFYFRTTDVTGTIELPEGVVMVMPGDNIKMVVTLIHPIAMDDGLRFAIREGGRTVGAGVVAKVIE